MRGNCPKCGSPIQVVNTYVTSDDKSRVRLTGCRACGFRPSENKEVVPLRYAPRRA